MNSVFAQYPEFVASGVLDMLVGPQEHHKAKFQSVLDVITDKLSRYMKGRERVVEMERWLNAQPAHLLLSVETTNVYTSSKSIFNRFFGSSWTVFVLEWNKSVFHGPQTIFVEYRRGGMLQTPFYVVPTDAESDIIERRHVAEMDFVGLYDFYDFYDDNDVEYHTTLKELYEVMLEENQRYRTRIEHQLLVNA